MRNALEIWIYGCNQNKMLNHLNIILLIKIFFLLCNKYTNIDYRHHNDDVSKDSHNDVGLPTNRRLSTRTVRNHLKSAELKSRRVIKCPLLAHRHWRTRLAWCLARRGWNLRTWRKIHWSDESRFLFHVTDGWFRIWRHKNTAYTPTVPYGGG